MKATDIQIGGNHYKDMIMQPIELINTLGCSFIQGCIIINALSNKYNVVITLCKELLQIEYPEKQ